ncbi:MAG TPA: Asp-tRNA(Asn)/Glu-tRNA(Gln) amidotransferase subunit GatC [Firmicutes bacterium]|nr:Asp-tRNA(Asn)/Glu-tRNA(Gln) amidotransferase subunit GatC [Bacillota bacterium]
MEHTLSLEEVRHVARLARLVFKPEEEEMFRQQLSRILDHVQRLNELDTSRVQPTFHVVPLKNVMRRDETRPCLPRDEVLANAPDAQGGFFRVPKITEG